MIRFKPLYLLFAIILCGAFVPAHADTLFTDSAFNLGSYTITTFTQNGATTNPFQCAACGNPNGAGNTALEIDMTFPTGTSTADTGLANNTFSYDPLTQGAITSVSASVDKDLITTASSGGGNTFRPLIEQGGVFYLAAIPGTGLSGPGTTGYLTLSQTGLTAASFVEFDFTTGLFGASNDNPNFDGSTMLFGLAQVSGSNGSADLTADYDNFSLDLATPTSAPEPSSLLLLGVGLAGLIVISRRKLAFNN